MLTSQSTSSLLKGHFSFYATLKTPDSVGGSGLSARESEILALICQGLDNQEIAGRAYLGVNTIKTYIRTAYRKIQVTTRSQAVIWGLSHGFEPDHASRVRP